MDYEVELIQVESILLDRDNPRHEPFNTQPEVIAHLCASENILQLAKDIAVHGLNPLEQLGVIPLSSGSYAAVEGNRRLCAIKLLLDPSIAPSASQRREFEKAAIKWADPFDEVPAIIFESEDDFKLWRERIHGGAAGGRGRKNWNAEQKARHTGNRKNTAAQILLDAGQKRGHISDEGRKGRLSVVQRHLSNPIFRNTLGLDISDPTDVTTSLPESDFDVLLKRFMGDVAKRSRTTRQNAASVVRYANQLAQTPGLGGGEVPLRSIVEVEEEEPPSETPRPRRPKRLTHIPVSADLEQAIEETGNYKLQQLYFSLCKVKLSHHTPLLTVGAWVFVETLTALVGRQSHHGFYAYLSADRLASLGLADRSDRKAVREAVKRLSENGNTTKHNQQAAAFNGEALANDFAVMENMLVALAKQAKP